jgi:prepilin-type N-terminal cleavage/methylation domain-containing protein
MNIDPGNGTQAWGVYRLAAFQAIWTNRWRAGKQLDSPLEKILMASSKQRGFSLLELSITLAIGLTIAGIAFVSLQPTLARARMDSGYGTAMMVLRDTRHLAVTQSHEYLVWFNPGGFPPGTLLVQYQPPAVGNGPLPPIQLVTTYTIPQDVSFSVKAGFPAAAPDSFGAGGTAIDFGQGLGGGSLNYVAFMPDGSARDTLGNLNSGVVYLSRTAGTMYESHAITVWGATGRIRGWRLVPQGGAPRWVQQ